ncbi:hypothetical protein SpCBS45565_g06175 [Spizellomyces sp. 'palustris']|nr:hypothetical protein SpCBS45565_g06175 [Spizellomyces sp. 'palustris']
MDETGTNDGTRITSVGVGPTPQWPAAEAMAAAAITTSAGAEVTPSAAFPAVISLGIPDAVVDANGALLGFQAVFDVAQIMVEEVQKEGLGGGSADGGSEVELLPPPTKL